MKTAYERGFLAGLAKVAAERGRGDIVKEAINWGGAAGTALYNQFTGGGQPQAAQKPAAPAAPAAPTAPTATPTGPAKPMAAAPGAPSAPAGGQNSMQAFLNAGRAQQAPKPGATAASNPAAAMTSPQYAAARQ